MYEIKFLLLDLDSSKLVQMQDKTEKLVEVIGHLYDATINPELWETFMHKAGELVSGRTGVLVLNPNGTPAHHLKQTEKGTFSSRELEVVAKYINFPEELLAIYMKKFFLHEDVWYNATLEKRINNDAFIGTELVALSDLRKTDFYKEVFNAGGNEYIVGAVLDVSPKGVTAFSMSRGNEKGNFSQEDKKIFKMLVPHLQRARVIFSYNEEIKTEQKLLKEALNACVSAVILIDEDAKVIFANNNAENVLRESDGILYKGGRIEILDTSQNREFQRLVGECIQTSRGFSLDAGGGLQVTRPSEKPQYRVIVTPLNMNSDHKRIDPLAAAAVFIYDTGELRPPKGSILSSMHGLTDTEVKVAHLFYQFYDLRKISEMLSIKKTTARTHFYSILKKTGAKSQAELMQMLDQLPREYF